MSPNVGGAYFGSKQLQHFSLEHLEVWGSTTSSRRGCHEHGMTSWHPQNEFVRKWGASKLHWLITTNFPCLRLLFYVFTWAVYMGYTPFLENSKFHQLNQISSNIPKTDPILFAVPSLSSAGCISGAADHHGLMVCSGLRSAFRDHRGRRQGLHPVPRGPRICQSWSWKVIFLSEDMGKKEIFMDFHGLWWFSVLTWP